MPTHSSNRWATSSVQRLEKTLWRLEILGTFKTHFIAECQDYKDDTKQVSTSSYKVNQLLQDTTSQVLNQIKSESLQDDETLKDLRSQKNLLTCQAVGRNNEVTELKQTMKDLQQQASNLTNSSDHNKKERLHEPDCYCYCWTHGRTGFREYTSATCKNPKDGHVKTATIADRKNGAGINRKWWLGTDTKSRNNFVNNITHNQRLNLTHRSLNSSHTPNFDSTKHLSTADTGASRNYSTSDSIPLGNIELRHRHLKVVLPNS